MRVNCIAALIALNLAACLAAPQNNVAVEANSESGAAETVRERHREAKELLDYMQNDQSVRVCANYECKWLLAGDAKGMDMASLQSVSAAKGDDSLARVLAPATETVMSSMKGLDAQKAMLENLQKEMAALTNAFSKGEAAANTAQNQYASFLTKGASAPAAPPSKGVALAPPSKGASAAAVNMQLEAALCPTTLYELGKCQKLSAETRAQLDNSNAVVAVLQGSKKNLENALAIAELGKAKAQEQAAFNAKYAAEQKSRGDALAQALALANAEKAALERQKAELESNLAATQSALAAEKQTTESLTAALEACNEDKAKLEEEKAELSKTLKETQDTLRKTQQELEREKNAHARTRRQLEATQQELAATEKARQQLEEAKQQLEDELAETKNQLDTMTAERDQLQVTLDATSAALTKANEEKLKCQTDLEAKTAEANQLTSQLSDALVMLAAEKKAREELTNTIYVVKAASEKVQEEVKRLQLENVQLLQQIQKLRAEQDTAMALAAGCPPTYEKFGLSCYKYVREKTQWKMAQEQCMKDGGNLVSVESRQEQAYLVDYLRRHGASDSDAYSLTSGYKQMNYWKWLGSNERFIGEIGPQYWFNEITKAKPGYDCQAMYLKDSSQYGKWVSLPCYSPAPYTCEVLLAPPGTAAPANAAESLAVLEMFKEAPLYLAAQGQLSPSKGGLSFAPPALGSKGLSFAAPNLKGR